MLILYKYNQDIEIEKFRKKKEFENINEEQWTKINELSYINKN